MKVLLVCATAVEAADFLEVLSPMPQVAPWGKRFAGQLENQQVDLLITGIGMVNTALALGAIHPTKETYCALINFGICGSYTTDLPLGSPVELTEDCYGELGAEDGENWLNLKQMGFQLFQTPTQQVFNCLANPHPSQLGYRAVRGVTHNQVSGNPETIDRILQRWHPEVESMEGAVTLQAALQHGIRYAAFRGVSNYVGPRSTSLWEVEPAIEVAQQAVREFLRTL